MDRGRRAEPYSNATIWTREIARNLAGHLDRLSKVHSCVDTASPKTAHLPQSKHGHHPLKRVGQVSPLKLHNATALVPEDGDAHDHHPMTSRGGDSGEERDDRRESQTERAPGGGSASPKAVIRPKSKKKAKSSTRRSQAEMDRLEALAVENQRLQEQIAAMQSATDLHEASGDGHETQPAVSHTKKSATMDYHKRHKQQQILQENQALAKRLKNTKPTLSSKEWEKDDKWNQQFLKTQERRRQALHNEMARTLASPHSALIRVKHVAGPGSSVHGRPATDSTGVDDTAETSATVIEVTTTDAASTSAKTRGVRRRRSSNEDTASGSGDARHYSTAANHRRIMELRKQREVSQGRGSGDGSSGLYEAEEHGPTDELVSVRFTFSRGGDRVRSLAGGLSTPNGVTGQFSPAIELETALESAYPAGEELQPVPMLDPLHTSRLEEEDDDDSEANSIVFAALQDCIDMVVTLDEEHIQKPTQGDVEVPETHWSGNNVLAGEAEEQHQKEDEDPGSSPVDSSIPREDADELVSTISAVAEAFADPSATESDQDAVETTPERAPIGSAVEVEGTPEQEQAVMDFTENGAAVEAATTGSEAKELDASGYGSEFDVEEDGRPSTGDADPMPPMAAIADASEDGEDEYEDDNVDEDAAPEEPTSLAPPPLHPEENEAEALYDDDLEPEDPAELSYSDDGFTGDE